MEIPVISKSDPTFCDSFWTREDYATGVSVLFSKLQQGTVENDEILTLAKLRAECEEMYGMKLQDISTSCVKMGGFMTDEGATARKAFDGLRKAMDEIEDAEEEKKYAFQEPPEKRSVMSFPSEKSVVLKVDDDDNDDDDLLEISDRYYSSKELAPLIAKMMDEIPRGEVTVRILGTYTDVYNGSDMVSWIEKNMLSHVPESERLRHAESVGQDFIDNGLLRLVGNMGNSFANSSVFKYQWRKKAQRICGRQLCRKNTISSASNVPYVGAYLGKLSATLNPHPDETPQQRLHREATEADEMYKNGVFQLDKLRTSLEEAMLDHYKFMEKCESDRLKAVKSVVLDFSAAISNVIHGLKASVDDLLLYQETIRPENDLRFMIESSRTGPFIPRVVPYENYYNIVDEQCFGVDLEFRARQDGKRVPVIVSSILTYLDMQYPTLESDTGCLNALYRLTVVRQSVWLIDVPLAETHRLRSVLNSGQSPIKETLALCKPAVVVSLLKLWLLELPDSLIPSSTYDLIKTVYSTHGNDKDPSARIGNVENALHQMRISNIATLDAIVTHFNRFIEITSSDENFVVQLAFKLSPCILRPRSYSAMTIQDKHGVRLLQDLLAYKEEIFEDLKRNISANRPRTNTASTDESNRRMHMEARQRAITAAALANGSTSPRPISPTTEYGRSHQQSFSSKSQFGTPSPISERSGHRISTGSTRSLTHGSLQQTSLVSPPHHSMAQGTPPSSSHGLAGEPVTLSITDSQTSEGTARSVLPPDEIGDGRPGHLETKTGGSASVVPSKRGSLGRSSHLARRGGAMLSRHPKKDITPTQISLQDSEGYIDADAAQTRESYVQRNSLEEEKRPSE